MYCSKCGKELPNEAEFCGYCGNSVKINSQASEKATQIEILEPIVETKKSKKKMLIPMISIALALVLVCGCAYWFFIGRNLPNTCDDSIVGNMNSIEWYLKTQYDVDDISKVRFYDGITNGSQSFVFVQLPSETYKPEDGKFLVFAYYSDLGEGIRLIGESPIFYEDYRHSLALGDDVTFWGVVLKNQQGDKDSMYVTFDKRGRLQRLLASSYVFDYKYDDKDRVEEVVLSEANGDSDNADDLYGSVFIHEEITEQCRFTYEYKEDGKLDRINATRDIDAFSEEEIAEYQEVAGEQNCSIDDDTFTWCHRYFAYVGGERVAVSNYFTTVSLEYNDDGYIEREKTSSYGNRDNPYYINYEYGDKQITYGGSSLENTYTDCDDLVFALIEALVNNKTEDALKLFDAYSMDALYNYMNAQEGSIYDWRTETSRWLDESLKPYLLEGRYTYEVTDYDLIGGTEETNSARNEAGMVFDRAYQLVFDHYYLAILEKDGYYYLSEDFIHLW